MKYLLRLCMVCLLSTVVLQGAAQGIASHSSSASAVLDSGASDYNLFSATSVRSAAAELTQVTKGTLFSLNASELTALRTEAPQSFTLVIPMDHAPTIILELNQIKVFTDDFFISTDLENSQDQLNLYESIDLGVHYSGKVAGDESSLVSFSVYENEVSAIISTQGFDYDLGKLKNSLADYIIYRTSDLSESVKQALGTISCGTTEVRTYSDEELNFAARNPGDITEIYLVAANSLYLANGSSLSATVNRMITAFAQTVVAYANESISVQLSGAFVWTGTQPFPSELADFRNYYNAAGDGWPGDLAHLIESSGANASASGVAYLDVLCDSNNNYGNTSVGDSAPIGTLPSYSRFVKVLTHEIGHNFGSSHTHACAWNGNSTQIDDYGNTTPGSSPLPYAGSDGVNGGCYTGSGPLTAVTPTIMSYYDSYGWGTFSLGNGFGTQPGNVIRSAVANATCLGDCATSTIIYLPNSTADQGPAIILCDTEPAPANYTAAFSQSCAQSVIDSDPYCLETFWDGVCQDAYNVCCPGTTIYLPNSTADQGPAIILCDTEPAPANYTAAASQSCAQSVIDGDPFCLETFWDNFCQDAYDLCVTPLPTCTDGIQNGNETGVDCGGPDCPTCPPTCTDGIQNGDETGVDCGGPDCPTCPPTCTDGIQNGDETGVDCGGPDCAPCECTTGTIIYLPNSFFLQGPAIILCDTEPAPANYTAAASQSCAQSVIDGDPYCLEEFWYGVCQAAYNLCVNPCTDGIQNGNETGVDCGGPDCAPCECTTGTIIYLPNSTADQGPAIILCDTEPAPANYTAAASQSCAQSVIDGDPYCLETFWDNLCQDAYDLCVNPATCQVPSNLAVVEIGFGTTNPRVNATWTNAEGTTNCEVRGGRISNASYTAGEPEFANAINTQTITQTNGSTVNFNVALYNNPNIPFTIGARYGFEVRCQCSDGSGLSEWANITTVSTFVVPAIPPGAEASGSKLLEAGLLEMSIYPNPADAVVNVGIELVEEGSVDIQIFNAVGQLVMQERNSGTKANIRMDVSNLEAGLYIMSVRTDIGIVTERLIIE
jgi:hypothetical protein